MSPLGTRKYQSRDGGPGFPLSQPSCTPATPRATSSPGRQTGTLTRRHVTWDPRLVTELPMTARLPTVSSRIEIHGWERHDVTLTTPGQRTSRADMRYLELVGGPVPWLMGSMPVWVGVPRLGQLSWDWSMDKHADGLSE